MKRTRPCALKRATHLACLVACLGAALPASAGYTTVDLPTLNTNIGLWTDGAVYESIFPGLHLWNGVPFELAEDAGGNKAFFGARNVPMDIPVGVFGVTEAYTIINTYRGYAGFTAGSIEFFGSGGAYQLVNLVEGINVADHYWGDWNNVIDGTNAMLAWSVPNHGSHLDMQIHHLTADFADETLATIRFTNKGFGNLGQPFIAAATVYSAVSVPEPATGAMLLAGMGVLGLLWRRLGRQGA